MPIKEQLQHATFSVKDWEEALSTLCLLLVEMSHVSMVGRFGMVKVTAQMWLAYYLFVLLGAPAYRLLAFFSSLSLRRKLHPQRGWAEGMQLFNSSVWDQFSGERREGPIRCEAQNALSNTSLLPVLLSKQIMLFLY